MIVTRKKRTGITLTEVLIALFIMALGMIALLVMFPLGAQQIAQAVKDERSAQAANNADNLFRIHWRKHVISYLKNGGAEANLVDPTNYNRIDYMIAMESPSVSLPILPVNPPLFLPATPGFTVVDHAPTPSIAYPGYTLAPSYPVFVDPNGVLPRTTGLPATFSRDWVAGMHPNTAGVPVTIGTAAGMTRVPRRSLNFPLLTPPANWQFRYCTLQDDIDFSQDGSANNGSGTSRTGRYNWAWVVQRPELANRTKMNLTVVVYDQRAYNFAAPDEEIAYPVQLAVDSTTIDIPYDDALNLPLPILRPGNWIMDGTIGEVNPIYAPYGIRNANFYRVVSVTDNPATRTLTVDLQTPIKRPLSTNIPSYLSPVGAAAYANGFYPGQIYVLKGVAEVFERRQLTYDDIPFIP